MKRITVLIFLLCLMVGAGFTQAPPAPKDVLGFTPGDDRKLASWAKVVEYFKKLDASSDRMIFREIGKTTMGKPFTYAVISSPENLKKLDYYMKINDKLADPRMFNRDDKAAAELISKGKTFVLITHGIHSTEVGSTIASTLVAHMLVSSNSADVKKILDETIVVLVPSLNPDGVDIIKNWYDKTLGTKFEGTRPPELYHKYVGHDNNRDWYAFTQIETQYTVEKIHNVFHPQIVHDVHQQGSTGARFFVPPYLDPVEPNVPKEIIEGYTEIGNYIADSMRNAGFKGITTGSTYDAWTPARAYSHYHGGARILSETASARMASPIKVDYAKMTSRRGFDVNKVSANYSPLWKGGSWSMRDITKYMKTGAFYLMKHAAENREGWLKRFYKIGKDATRPRNKGELWGYVIPVEKPSSWFKTASLVATLALGGVEVERLGADAVINGTKVSRYSFAIRLAQPYGMFAKAMLENGGYPNLIDEKGEPIRPYDVTSHSLSLLMGVRAIPVSKALKTVSDRKSGFIVGAGPDRTPLYKIYRSYIPSMDEGWTRWIVTRKCRELSRPCWSNPNISNKEIIENKFSPAWSILFPDQSTRALMKGYPEGSMPSQYTGGLEGKGVKNLHEYVKRGGTLVFMNSSVNFAIEQFNLPVKNIARDWKRKDFFIPGSILRTELDTNHPIAKGMPKKSIAWFQRSPVFEIVPDPRAITRARVIARYPRNPKDILLSGWALGKEKLAGKAAIVEVGIGKGRIILFGFRPQYRGQSMATFPLMYNAMTYVQEGARTAD